LLAKEVLHDKLPIFVNIQDVQTSLLSYLSKEEITSDTGEKNWCYEVCNVLFKCCWILNW